MYQPEELTELFTASIFLMEAKNSLLKVPLLVTKFQW